MKKANVFQTDDIYDKEQIFCKCAVKQPLLNGHNNHWICKTCGNMVGRKDRKEKAMA